MIERRSILDLPEPARSQALAEIGFSESEFREWLEAQTAARASAGEPPMPEAPQTGKWSAENWGVQLVPKDPESST